MELSAIIIEKIKKEGPISFCDFMEMALYYPVKGYYMSSKEKIGKAGDYYTSPTLSSLFGHTIGKQIEQMWNLLDREEFTIVEYGAGTGELCFDLLTYLKKNSSLYKKLKYFIIEKSESMKQLAKNLLCEKVEWINDITEAGGISGCVLSNEVIDNFPVNVVMMQDELMEVFVDFSGEFTEVLKPAPDALKKYLAVQNINLPKGYRTEINLNATSWIQKVAKSLNRGFVITIDYGFPCYEIYSPQRSSGTLTCYNNHIKGNSFYSNIGLQDITAHVNFSALQYWGKLSGLECSGFCNQNFFMRSLGVVNDLRVIEKENLNKNREILFQLNKLLFDMGNKFKVLIQQKGIKLRQLDGMRMSEQLT